MNKRACICFAYFGDGKFLGWYADSFGSIRKSSPKIYGDSPEQRAIVAESFGYKVMLIRTETVGKPDLVDAILTAEKDKLFKYKEVELRVVACPYYDGPNPDFDKEKHDKLVAERKERMKAFLAENGVDYDRSGPSLRRLELVREFDKKDSFPECNNWIYCDYEKVKEWASVEPTEFLDVIKANS